MAKLNEVCTALGKAHKAKKEETTKLEKRRNEFFELATKKLENTNLAKVVIQVPEGVDPLAYAIKYHPGYRVVDVESVAGVGAVQLEEDPAFKKFVFINLDDGQVYQRNTTQPQPQLDDELIQKEDLDLWERITYIENYRWLSDLLYEAGMDVDDIEDYLTNGPYPAPRVLKQPEDIDPTDLKALEKYLVPSPISLRLETPRAATEEELDEANA
jgi:hypothetical protein